MKGKYNLVCHRCQDETPTLRSSWFNTQMLCPACCAEEAVHPLYIHAQQVEFVKIQTGDYRFFGIGLPDDLQRKYRSKKNRSFPYKSQAE